MSGAYDGMMSCKVREMDGKLHSDASPSVAVTQLTYIFSESTSLSTDLKNDSDLDKVFRTFVASLWYGCLYSSSMLHQCGQSCDDSAMINFLTS
jgi:hypothetical protein